MARKIIIWVLIITFCNSYIQPLYAQNLVPEFLCELGVKAYKQGDIPEALGNFNKALLANPSYVPAREYIKLIRKELARRQGLEAGEGEVAAKPLPKPKVKLPAALPKIAASKPVALPVQPQVKPVVTAKPAAVEEPVIVEKPVVAAKPVTAKQPVVKTPVIEQPVVAEAAPVPAVITPAVPTVVEPVAAVPVQTAPAPVAVSKPAPVLAEPVRSGQPAAAVLSEAAAMEKAMKQLEYLSAVSAPAAPSPVAISKPVETAKPAPVAAAPAPAVTPVLQQAKTVKPLPGVTKQKLMPSILMLDDSAKSLTGALELEQGREVIIRGRNIQRFLLTQPAVLDVRKQSSDELLAKADNFGYTYLHVWDDNGRWTLEFLTVPVKPEGPSYEELLRRSEERAGTFKLRYSMDWNEVTTGRGVGDLERTSYTYSHYLTLTGPSPYGDLDASASVQKSATSTDLNYFTAGLTNGKLGPFEGFSLRAVDYAPPITNLEFSAPTLRGVELSSPAFNKKIEYTTFWGREGGGRYGALSPGLNKIKSSFLSGMDINYFLSKNQNYGMSLFRGWGRDRASNLNTYGYDTRGEWRINKWNIMQETAYDSENLAHLFTATYEIPKFKLTNEFRDTAKNFVTMTGSGWRVGELGNLINAEYTPTKDIGITGRFDVYQDRLFPNPASPDTWNTDFRTDLAWRLDEDTSWRTDYSYQNDTGRIAPFRSQNMGTGLYRSFEKLRRMTAYVTYRHQEDTHFSATNLNFTDNKATAGLRFNLYKEFYYYLSQEYNWLLERSTGLRHNPQAMETGVDWNRQLFTTPFYGSVRFLYRDEQDTASPLSFMSGEDYIEGYAMLSYRPTPDKELYCSTRVRNVWADNATVNKHIDADFNAGMRYTWDTGVRWEPIGSIDGYVFRDMNSDGLRESGEDGLEGVKLWLGKKSTETDKKGYYKFDKIRARKAYVNLDTQSLPAGFVLTVPVTQEASIANHKSVKINFGVNSRSEIWGIVYVDTNGDNKFSPDKDKGIKGVVFTLEDGKKAVSDGNGQYRFPNVTPGEHIVTLDLNTLPVEYLPSVPLKKTAVVFEGVSYNYNVPVKKTAQ